MSDNPSPPSLHASNTKFAPVQYQDAEGNWRVKVVAQREKFDDEAKETFLAEYSQHGRMSDSARAAGVTPPTVRRHMENDSDFAEACLAAEHTYRDRLIAHHQDLVFEGTTKVTYDRQGNVVSEEKVYPVRLIELELKKHDEGYRDKREVDMKVSGGVLIAPADVGSIDDWEAKFADGKTIEGEAQEVDQEEG
jgi:hypothetical protein